MVRVTRVLVTGGSGTLGRALAARLVHENLPWDLAIFSRDEVKQAEMAEMYGRVGGRFRFMLGDVRDRDRLALAMRGCQAVVHAAALKRMETGVYDPEEMVRTNVQGTINVVRAAVETGVAKVLVVSTDKAVAPTTLYGATKLVAERFAISSNAYAFPQGTRVSVVRYGNVIDSRGSVLHLYRRLAAEGRALPITDPACTRFLLTSEQAVSILLGALERMTGGETFVPADVPAARVVDLAEAVAPGVPHAITGLRGGSDEKLHEELMTPVEIRRAMQVGASYVIHPDAPSWRYEPSSGVPIVDVQGYRSNGGRMMTIEEIRRMVGGKRA